MFSWAIRSGKFCCECHKGKDLQGSYWKKWESKEQSGIWKKVENFIVPSVNGFCFLEATNCFLTLCIAFSIKYFNS